MSVSEIHKGIMDGLYLGSQLSKEQLLPTQPSSSTASPSLSLIQQQHQQQQHHHQHHQQQQQQILHHHQQQQQQHLLLQTRTGSQSRLRTSRSPSATRSTEQTFY